MNFITENWLPITCLVIAVIVVILAETWRMAHQRGYDLGKSDGLAEGWRKMDEQPRNKAGQYTFKRRAASK